MLKKIKNIKNNVKMNQKTNIKIKKFVRANEAIFT